MRYGELHAAHDTRTCIDSRTFPGTVHENWSMCRVRVRFYQIWLTLLRVRDNYVAKVVRSITTGTE